MKKFALILASLIAVLSLSLFGCGDGETATLSGELLTGGYVKWEGRYEEKDIDGETGVVLYHTASGFTVDFDGTELEVGFYSEIQGGKPYYNLAVDDEVLPVAAENRTFSLSGGKERIKIVSGLSRGRHTVKCLKMSEPYDAITAVRSFNTDGGFIKRDADDDNANFKFMFVCASGGSGHGSLGYSEKNGYSARTTANSSSLHAFNYLTARMFGADVQFVANSGWGVAYPADRSVADVLDYTGITTSNNVTGAKTTATWDYDSWVPEVIIFNIGGNDTVQGGFTQSLYQKKVVQMVEKLHEKYPSAYMLWTHTGSNAGSFAVSAMTDAGIMSAGYMKVAVIPKVGADGSYGANGHNSFKTHIATAEIIAGELTKNWGFTAIYENVLFEDYESVLKKF